MAKLKVIRGKKHKTTAKEQRAFEAADRFVRYFKARWRKKHG